jgi:hypothetical protein
VKAAAKAKATRTRRVGRTAAGRPSAPTRRTSVEPVERAARPAPRLNRARRTLDETVPSPPSSLNMDRRGSAVRTGRAELKSNLTKHPGMTPAITGGDVDANWENAYFSGDEAPGGDNPTPDQEVVEEIGRSLGVEYQDSEELQGGQELEKRDKKRWELDPASSEDYRDRD